MLDVSTSILFIFCGTVFSWLLYLLKTSGPKPKPKGEPVATITELVIFPIKSCGGISVNSAVVGRHGFVYDRQWMLTTKKTDRFLTQRQYPKMTLISLSFHPDGQHVQVDAPGMPSLMLPLSGVNHDYEDPNSVVQVGIWKSNTLAIREGEEVANWFRTFLDAPDVELVRFIGVRSTNQKYWESDGENLVSLADGFPFLLASKESLNVSTTHPYNQLTLTKDLDSTIRSSGSGSTLDLSMRRFRPNIVIEGASAWAEDKWMTINFGVENSLTHAPRGEFKLVKACPRCKIPTISLDKAEFDPHEEPLATIKARADNPGCFGQNLQHSKQTRGVQICVGMRVFLLENKSKQQLDALAEKYKKKKAAAQTQ